MHALSTDPSPAAEPDSLTWAWLGELDRSARRGMLAHCEADGAACSDDHLGLIPSMFRQPRNGPEQPGIKDLPGALVRARNHVAVDPEPERRIVVAQVLGQR